MKRHLSIIAILVSLSLTAWSQSTCDAFSTTLTNGTNLGKQLPSGTQEHNTNPSPSLHAWGLTPIGFCTYSHGTSSKCNTVCHIQPQGSNLNSNPPNPLGNVISEEVGKLSVPGSHLVNGSFIPGDGGANGAAASCTAQLRAAAVNCGGIVGCSLSLDTNSGNLTVKSNAPLIWDPGAQNIPFSCSAVTDPQNTISGGGIPVNPCLNGATASPQSGGFVSPTCSPIIIDVEGEGFHLTSAEDGVVFDIRGDGHPIRIAWTATGFHNGFLVLDRNGDGIINDGTELFGNFTQQDPSAHPNGFLALAEFDKPQNGGNEDGIIDEHDAVFPKLRIWIDANHDGISQPDELHTLQELGIFALSLDYNESRRRDDFGNEFRYKARVNPGPRRDARDGASEVGRWTYDVFLVTQY